MAASLVGAAATQYPLGNLSDRVPRRRVILGVAAAATGIAVARTAIDPGGTWQFVIVAMYGSLAFPTYSLAVSHVNDVMPENQLVATAAGIVFVFGGWSHHWTRCGVCPHDGARSGRVFLGTRSNLPVPRDIRARTNHLQGTADSTAFRQPATARLDGCRTIG